MLRRQQLVIDTAEQIQMSRWRLKSCKEYRDDIKSSLCIQCRCGNRLVVTMISLYAYSCGSSQHSGFWERASNFQMQMPTSQRVQHVYQPALPPYYQHRPSFLWMGIPCGSKNLWRLCLFSIQEHKAKDPELWMRLACGSYSYKQERRLVNSF